MYKMVKRKKSQSPLTVDGAISAVTRKENFSVVHQKEGEDACATG